MRSVQSVAQCLVLTLRSHAKRGVSKGRPQARCSCPPFETLAALAPQGEAFETALRASSG